MCRQGRGCVGIPVGRVFCRWGRACVGIPVGQESLSVDGGGGCGDALGVVPRVVECLVVVGGRGGGGCVVVCRHACRVVCRVVCYLSAECPVVVVVAEGGVAVVAEGGERVVFPCRVLSGCCREGSVVVLRGLVVLLSCRCVCRCVCRVVLRRVVLVVLVVSRLGERVVLRRVVG